MRASPLSTDLVHLLCIRGEYLNSCFPIHSIPNQSELYRSAYPHSGISQGQTQDTAAILILSSAVRWLKTLSLSCIFLINVPDSCHDHPRWPSWCFRTALIRLDSHRDSRPVGPSPGDQDSSQQAARGRPSSQVSLPQPRQSYSSTFVFVVSVSVVSNLSAAPAKATVMPVKSG